jgi:hypothetical protein
MARVCLDRRCSADASALGRQALQAADALDSPTERIVATALLIEAVFASDKTGASDRLLSSLRELLGDKPVAPRSRAALQRLYDRYPGTTTILQPQPH